MAELRQLSPLVEPLSLDEAFVDLAAAELPDHTVATVTEVAERLKERVHEVTGGLTGSVGIGTSKLIAKIASDLRQARRAGGRSRPARSRSCWTRCP